jgi:hypothetical protein
MKAIRMGSGRFKLALIAVVALAGCDDGISDEDQSAVTVQVDLTTALQRLDLNKSSIAVLDSVILTASTGVSPSRSAVKFVPGQTNYSFDLMVNRRTVTIAAQVTNTAQTPLLSGSIAQQIRGPVTINNLLPVAPILAVGPDSVVLRGDPFTLTIANRGRGLLNWSVQNIPCGLSFVPESGALAENATLEIRVTQTAAVVGGLLTVSSNGGSVAIPMINRLASVDRHVAIPSITTPAGQPVNAANVQGQIQVNAAIVVPPCVTFDTVQVILDNTVVCTVSIAGLGGPITVGCPINTAEINTATGTLRFANGPHTIQVRVFKGPTVAGATSIALIFNNS